MTSDDTNDLDISIRALAYELWEHAGKPDGREQEFWARAQQMLSGGTGPDGLTTAQSDTLTA